MPDEIPVRRYARRRGRVKDMVFVDKAYFRAERDYDEAWAALTEAKRVFEEAKRALEEAKRAWNEATLKLEKR